MNDKLVPLKEINDDQKFFRGTRFRQYNMGMNVENIEDDYYEYMLAQIPGEKEYMLLICIEGYKAGTPLAYVRVSEDKSTFIVTGKAMKDSMGVDNTYLLPTIE
jgi:hypothetical protein